MEDTSRKAMELLLETGKQLTKLDVIYVDPAKGRPFAVLPQGMTPQDLSAYLPFEPFAPLSKQPVQEVQP